MLSKELELLTYKMRQKKIDAFIVPREDMFSGEEVPKSEERLKYITNFSGSAGFAIILSNTNLKSAIFSDGRYQLQLRKQVDTKYISKLKYHRPRSLDDYTPEVIKNFLQRQKTVKRKMIEDLNKNGHTEINPNGFLVERILG